MQQEKRRYHTTPRFLSTACLFDCFDDDSFCVFAGEICDGQVRDGLSAAGLFFRIDGNLGNLYCYPWRVAINNYNVSFLFLGHGVTPTNIFTSTSFISKRQPMAHGLLTPSLLATPWYHHGNYVVSMTTT